VGAAGLVDDGRVVVGCNVENASYGLTLCAECGLVSALHAGGGGRLVAVAVTDPERHDLAPCGRCRQLLSEAGGPDLAVNERPLREWLPDAFGPDHLG
jgi:cytidine deaminase